MRTTVTIRGMSCVHCRRAVFTALSGVPGVASADVVLGRAVVDHASSVTREALTAAIAEAGYEVTGAESDRRVLPQIT